MPQFKEFGFTFDGIQSSDLGYYIVNATDSNDNILGLKKSINEEDIKQSTKAFYGIALEEFEFEIDICKANPSYDLSEIKQITEDDLRFLNKWLIMPREYKVFSSDQNRDIYYYAMFTGIKEKDFGNVNYLTLTMRLNAGFSYSAVMHHQHVVTGDKTFDISTKSNVDDYIYPDIDIKTTGGVNQTLRIINETLGETMEFWNIPSGVTLKCYNEDMKYIKCVEQPTLNMRPLFNAQWLRVMGDSVNTIRVEGNCEIDIYFQNKIAIQH